MRFIFNLKIAKEFLLLLNLFYFLALLLPTAFIFRKFESLIYEQVRMQAESIYQQIVVTRKWIADHGGIYVEKLPWVEPNPYLLKVGVNPTIKSKDGRILIKENPALVTRQLSEYSRKSHLYWFKITSLRFINPLNKPDQLEAQALLSFEKEGLQQFETVERIENTPIYRYIKPLRTEPSCLPCHEAQGYKIGDVRGAISIFVPISFTLERLYTYQLLTIFIFAGGFVVLNAIILFVSHRFIFSPLHRIVSLLKTLQRLYHPRSIPYKNQGIDNTQVTNEWQLIIKSINELIETINIYERRLEEDVRKATQELEEKNKFLEDLLNKKSFMLCSMAHEIKTPLTSLKGSLEYLSAMLQKRGDDLPEEVRERIAEFLKIASRNTERLIKLLTYIVEIEKAEANLLELEIEYFCLKELMAEAIAIVESLAKEKEVRFILDIPENVYLRADREKILTILLNLLTNGIKHSPTKGIITVRVREQNGFVHFEVEDEGPGLKVPEEVVFEKFYKGDDDGFGLGLTIAKAYVMAHQGKIGTKKGQRGAIFYFSIPQGKI